MLRRCVCCLFEPSPTSGVYVREVKKLRISDPPPPLLSAPASGDGRRAGGSLCNTRVTRADWGFDARQKPLEKYITENPKTALDTTAIGRKMVRHPAPLRCLTKKCTSADAPLRLCADIKNERRPNEGAAFELSPFPSLALSSLSNS